LAAGSTRREFGFLLSNLHNPSTFAAISAFALALEVFGGLSLRWAGCSMLLDTRGVEAWFLCKGKREPPTVTLQAGLGCNLVSRVLTSRAPRPIGRDSRRSRDTSAASSSNSAFCALLVVSEQLRGDAVGCRGPLDASLGPSPTGETCSLARQLQIWGVWVERGSRSNLGGWPAWSSGLARQLTCHRPERC
jgi:hypothetical protein